MGECTINGGGGNSLVIDGGVLDLTGRWKIWSTAQTLVDQKR